MVKGNNTSDFTPVPNPPLFFIGKMPKSRTILQHSLSTLLSPSPSRLYFSFFYI